jgi:hypothetical protein
MQTINDCKEIRLALTRAGIATCPEKCIQTFRLVVTAQYIYHTMHSAFCSRDQRAEARNAITCPLTSFALTSIAIRHAARETTRGWRNLLERPLADDVPCSRDHLQNVLATVRVVVLHTHVFCLPIALSARATTRRRRLLEKLADRSSQTGGVWETAL